MRINPLSGVTGMIKSKFSMIKNKFNISRLLQKLNQNITKFANKIFRLFFKKPSEKEDYVKVGGLYLSKRFIAIGTVVFIIFVYIFVKFLFPWAEGNLWTAEIIINSEKYSTFSGRARVVDTSGMLIYEGDMVDGKITGEGKQYNYYGELVYEGSFEDSQYSGQGKLYNSGVMIYEGAFSKNMYEGQGSLYNQQGQLIYSGNFSLGQRSGKGIEYNPNTGLKAYYGDFANDLKEGTGLAYDTDGKTVIYEGSFSAGEYSGSGSLYENTVLKYQGDFAKNLFNGQGTLYNTSTKKILYQGEFVDGLYEGEGTLYDEITSKVVYKGEFLKGYKDGEGIAYDKLGTQVFSGSFKEGSIDYISYLGQSMDSVTEQFGKYSYKTQVDTRQILTYVSLDASLVFNADEDKGTYSCEKIIMGTKEPFKGITSTSTKEQLVSIFGTQLTSANYQFDKYYDTVFSNLSIGLSSNSQAPSIKFVLGSYFIRCYYNSEETKILAIEISNV